MSHQDVNRGYWAEEAPGYAETARRDWAALGDTIKHLGDISNPAARQEVQKITGSTSSVGFKHGYLDIFWLDVWGQLWHARICCRKRSGLGPGGW